MITMMMGEDAVGKVVGAGASLLLYWGLFTFLFRIKAWQTMICVACIVLVNVMTGFFIGALVGMIIGRPIH